MLERYLTLVLARPDDEAAVRRLLERATRSPGGVEGLLASLEARRGELGPRLDLAVAAIALARSDLEVARAAVVRALGSAGDEVAPQLLLARLERRAGALAQAREALRAAAARARGRERDTILRDLAGLLLDLGSIDEARALFEELARGGSVLARTELFRGLVQRGLCEPARAAFPEAARAAASDPSAAVGLALSRSRCERELGDAVAAHMALSSAFLLAQRAGRTPELLDAMVALARETGGLEALAEELTGQGAPATLHRGVVLEELGRETEALVVFRQVLARDPRDAETRQRVARLLARNGRSEEALEEQRELARRFPDRIALTLELATALRDHGHGDESLTVLDRARARSRRDRTALFVLVDAYSRLGARDRVLDTLEAIVRAAPDDPRGLVALANELIDRGERDRALELVERLARSTRDGVTGELEAARALANLRVFDRALLHLEAAARLSPDAPEVLDTQADLYARMGRDDAADSALERRIALGSGSPGDPLAAQAAADAEARLVASWARRGALARKRPELEARHALGDASASRMLADVQRRMGALDAALTTLTELAARTPTDLRLWTTLARLHHERGDYDAEVLALRRLAELEPSRAGWHYTRLVELALASYRDADAIGFADEAARRSIDDAGLFLRLGRLHARRRDTERAAEAYGRALALDPDQFEAAWELATIERERGQGRRAVELYLAILERSRDDELRDRSGHAALEVARAEGLEASLEPRMLSLALAHGDAPVFRRIALALYASLTAGARARAEAPVLERWVSRALPILLASLRDSDVGARASARQLLFAHPVAGAATALVALASDEGVEPAARADALAAAVGVVSARDEAALLELLDGPSETLAILALHGVMRLLGTERRTERDRERVLAPLRETTGRRSDHAWAWTLLLRQGRGLPSEPPASTNAPWLAAWHAAPGGGAFVAFWAQQRAIRARDELPVAVSVELAATGTLGDAALDELAARALLGSDRSTRFARRTISSAARPAVSCAPVIEGGEALEQWLGRVLEACPRAARPSSPAAMALERAARGLPEGELVRALLRASGERGLPGWDLLRGPTVRALAARLLPVSAASDEAALALLRAAEVVPEVLDARAWEELLTAHATWVREASTAAAPLPAATERLVSSGTADPAWTVRRAALLRLRESGVDLEPRRRAATLALGDDVAFVRSAALALAATLPIEEACALAREGLGDPDPVVAESAGAFASACVTEEVAPAVGPAAPAVGSAAPAR